MSGPVRLCKYVPPYTHQNLSIVGNLRSHSVCPYYKGLLIRYHFTPHY